MPRKKSKFPVTRSCKPMPPRGTKDWLIWAAWADRITFEEIFKVSGKTETEVIRTMRRELKPSSFRKWRTRVNQISYKHQRYFKACREGF